MNEFEQYQMRDRGREFLNNSTKTLNFFLRCHVMMMTGDIRYKVNGMIKKKENRQKAINLIIPVKKKN